MEKAKLRLPRQSYLPHYGVYKKSAEKKKPRIMYDATAEYLSGSLNKGMISEPKRQRDSSYKKLPLSSGKAQSS